jgi:hypothetical protein
VSYLHSKYYAPRKHLPPPVMTNLDRIPFLRSQA